MESQNFAVGKGLVGHEKREFFINAFFVYVFYMVMAEKYPLPSLKEECTLIQLHDKYLLEL